MGICGFLSFFVTTSLYCAASKMTAQGQPGENYKLNCKYDPHSIACSAGRCAIPLGSCAECDTCGSYSRMSFMFVVHFFVVFFLEEEEEGVEFHPIQVHQSCVKLLSKSPHHRLHR